MTFTWLADFFVEDHPGGAQQTNDVMIKAGEKRGHTIKKMHTKEFDVDKLEGVVITNNITRLSFDNIALLMKRGRYMRYEHDYWTLKHIDMFPDLFKKSMLNIFLSPLHRRQFKRVANDEDKIHLQHSPVIGFEPGDQNRDGRLVLYTGGLAKHKGFDDLIAFAKAHPAYQFEVYGWDERGNSEDLLRQVPNCRFRGQTTNEKLRAVYQRAGYFIHLPEWKEPFGRTVMEAYLSGCHIIHNSNIGALSYGWDWGDYGEILKYNEEAPEIFWNKLESVK